MKGQFYIDGVNATERFGLFIAEGGYRGIASFPKLKPLEVNDWAEEEGLEIDLKNLKLQHREFEIDFVTINKNADIEGFMYQLMEKSYSSFSFPDIGVTKTLRFIKRQSLEGAYFQLCSFSLLFSEDSPMEDYTYEAPIEGHIPLQGYKIDGKDLSTYGIAVLERTESQFIAPISLKEGLVMENSLSHGLIADSNYVIPKEWDVTLKLLLRATTASVFKRNLYALMHDLLQDDERELYLSKNAQTYFCYYKELNIQQLFIDYRLWCEFELTLTIISNFIERRLYLFIAKGELQASDTLPLLNDGAVLLLSSFKGNQQVSDLIQIESEFSSLTGVFILSILTDTTVHIHEEAGFLYIN